MVFSFNCGVKASEAGREICAVYAEEKYLIVRTTCYWN